MLEFEVGTIITVTKKISFTFGIGQLIRIITGTNTYKGRVKGMCSDSIILSIHLKDKVVPKEFLFQNILDVIVLSEGEVMKE